MDAKKKMADFREKLDDYQLILFQQDSKSLAWWARFDAARKALLEVAGQLAV